MNHTCPPANPHGATEPGPAMLEFIARLFPLHRSITGSGLRQTLDQIAEHVPLQVREVPSGTSVFDWTVPDEWSVREAWIRDGAGQKVLDYQASNLHLVAYSTAFQGRLRWPELKQHLHTLPAHPDWIPYRTAYYDRNWGFCLTHRQLEQLDQHPDREYDVLIDASLTAGSLSYGEVVLPGKTSEEVLIWAHVCHPSLANDNLSGVAVATWLAKSLVARPRRYTYRFVFAPATIGAITWLAHHEEQAQAIRHGLVLTVLGDQGASTYKRSRRGDAEIDRAVERVLAEAGTPYQVRDFSPVGYDERQFCSPGFNLPVGCLMRTPNGEYPEYHTSADNLQLIDEASLVDSWKKCQAVVQLLEHNYVYLNLRPQCEPHLGRHGLYHAWGQAETPPDFQRAVQWVLNYADARHSLLDIAELSGLDFQTLAVAAEKLVACELMQRVQRL